MIWGENQVMIRVAGAKLQNPRTGEFMVLSDTVGEVILIGDKMFMTKKTWETIKLHKAVPANKLAI